MIGFDGDNRDHRRQARQAFERLDADGIVDMQRKGSGVFLFGPRADLGVALGYASVSMRRF